jgi:hypothetical protein
MGGGGAGITWLSDREIVFHPRALGGTGMYRVSADGGAPQLLARIDTASGERFQLVPRAADGGRLVFYSSTQSSAADLFIAVATVADGKTKRFPTLRAARALGLVGDLLVYCGGRRHHGGPIRRQGARGGHADAGRDSVATRNWDAAAALSQSGEAPLPRGRIRGHLVRVDAKGDVSVLVDRFGRMRTRACLPTASASHSTSRPKAARKSGFRISRRRHLSV